MAQAPTHDLFISYAESDAAWVEGFLRDALEKAGIRCRSQEDFRLGVPRPLELERHIRESRRTLLVLSPDYLGGFNEFVELLAQAYGQETGTWPVIPLILKPVELPARLGMLVPLDATDEANRSAVVKRLARDLGAEELKEEPVPDCPYPGMVAFGEKDHEHFCGRGEEVKDLVARLRKHPFLTVIGPSGSGKSSLVFAGLIPALRDPRNTSLFDPGEWLVRSLRPGERPLESLRTALGGEPLATPRTVRQLLDSQPGAGHLLLVADQFEEVFTLGQTDAIPFQRALRDLAHCPGVYVVLTVRADFYPELMESPLWTDIRAHRAEVLPLDAEGLREAIVQPAATAGVYVEATLVDRLIGDAAGEPGVLPLIQETLVLLWPQMERRYLPLRAYSRLILPHTAYASPDGVPRTGLQVAMAYHADAVLVGLKQAKERAVARRIFLRLIQFGEGRADTRRRQLVADLPSAVDDPTVFDRTLRHLVDNRLLTLSGQEKGRRQYVDLAHEALIAGWPTLQRWVVERRDADLTRRRLEAKVAEWVRLKKQGGLLDAAELAEAERWLKSSDARDLGYDAALPALAEASRAAIEQMEREREAARQRELAQAQALASEQQRVAEEQQKRAETERRRADEQATAAQRLRRRAIGLVILVLAAAALAGFAGLAMWQAQMAQQRAQQQARVALSRALAARAVNQLAVDPGQSLQLAVQAVTADRTAEAVDALRQSLLQAHVRHTLRGHTSRVTGVAFSRDGRFVVSGSADHTGRLWDVRTGTLVRVLRGHTDQVNSPSISPDGSLILTPSYDGTARLWDARSGRSLHILRGQTNGLPMTGAFSPDGRLVVTASGDGTARIWSVRTGRSVHALAGDGGWVNSAAFSPDGGRVVTAGNDGATRVWDAHTGKQRLVLRGHTGQVNYAEFSPDGSLVATAGADRTARIWNARTGAQIRVLRGHTDSISRVAFDNHGSLLVTASADHTARVWQVRTGTLVSVMLGHTGRLHGASFSPDGRLVVTASDDETARVWDATTGRFLQTLPGHAGPVRGALFSPDGKLVATAADNGTVRLWDVSAGTPLHVLRGHQDAVFSAAFDLRGALLVTASRDRTARIWNARTGHQLLTLRGHRDRVPYAAFSPDGSSVVTASGDGTARIWDARTGNLLHGLRGHTGPLDSAVFSRDGKLLVTPSQDGTAGVWNVRTGTLVERLRGHRGSLYSAYFSPDGRTVVTAGADGTARIWAVRTGKTLRILAGHKGPVYSATFSPDGKVVATAGDDGTARLWNADTGKVLRVLTGHVKAVINDPIFSPDGKLVVTASEDETARVWDVRTGRPVAILRGHTGWLTNAALSPDGDLVVTTSQDGTARLWEIQSSKLLLTLTAHTGPVNGAVFSPDGRFIATAGEDRAAQIYPCEVCGSVDDLLRRAQANLNPHGP